MKSIVVASQGRYGWNVTFYPPDSQEVSEQAQKHARQLRDKGQMTLLGTMEWIE